MPAISYRLLLFLCCVYLTIISQAIAQASFRGYLCDYHKLGNYTANSTYQTNLNTLLSNLTSNTAIDYGFYNISYGQDTDRVYAIGLCRGDVKPDKCRSCLKDSRILLTQICPNQKEAIGYYDECMLRYSFRSIFGIEETDPGFYLWNPYNATDWDRFYPVARNLMQSLSRKAASGDSRLKFAQGNATAPSFQNISFAIAQCTPDLSGTQCNDCLGAAIGKFPDACAGKRGCRVVFPSCNIRFESSNDPPPPPPPSTPRSPPRSSNITASSSGGKSNISRILIAIVVPVVAVALLTFIYIYLRGRKGKQRKKFETTEDDDSGIETAESLQFDFDTIRVATNDFSDSNKLGQGGFGVVYKGQFPNGQMIAVKMLSRDSGQGDLEFKNEVQLVAKLHHRNLVRLLGFCLEKRERILVYEFVPNKSLDYFIFDHTKRARLDWKNRYKIIVGVARGLLYLHEDSQLRIIHRDIKASNILLDDDMNPKISDFGMARLFVMDQTQGNTSRIVGTYGYMSPEYAMHGRFSVKSDVFSFGVLVLEIITGQRNCGICDGENVEDLLSFVWKNWKVGTVTDIVDPSIDNGSRNEIMRCIHIGLLCVHENVANRPTMAAVILMLNNHSISLPVPSEPAFFFDSKTRSLPDLQSWEYNSRATRSSDEFTSKSAQESVNETSITEPYPR